MIGNRPDGFNINRDCGSTHMETLRRYGLAELRPGQVVWVRFGDGPKGLMAADEAYGELSQYILQLHIVGFQAGFCSDQVNHGIPSN